MSQEQLTAYLQDESYLFSLSYEELKTLVMQYPYATNLRVLLLKKSYIEQNKDYERNLQTLATYTTNRKFLYKLVQQLRAIEAPSENVVLGEESLELAALSRVEKMILNRSFVESFDENEADTEGGAFLSIDRPNFFAGEPIEDNAPTSSEESAENIPHNVPNLVFEPFDDSIENSADSEPKIEILNFQSLIEEVDNEAFTTEEQNDAAVENVMSNVAKKDIDTLPDFDNTAFEVVVPSEQKEAEKEAEKIDLSEIFADIEDDDAEDPFYAALLNATADIDPAETIETAEETPINVIDIHKENENIVVEKAQNNISDFMFAFDTAEEIDKDLESKAGIGAEGVFEPIFEPQKAEIIAAFFEEIEEEETETVENTAVEEDDEKDDLPELTAKVPLTLEINNLTKAKIVENIPSETNTPRVKFTDWLRQFKNVSDMPDVAITEEKPIEIKDNPSPIIEEEMRILQHDRVAEIFEMSEAVPNNIMGMTQAAPAKKKAEYSGKDFEDVEKKKKKKKKREMHALAAKSIETDAELASETLADLLAWQGKIGEATEMYARLILKFPEKSAYFATKINNLKQG